MAILDFIHSTTHSVPQPVSGPTPELTSTSEPIEIVVIDSEHVSEPVPETISRPVIEPTAEPDVDIALTEQTSVEAPAAETVPSPEEVKETLKPEAPVLEEAPATTVIPPLADDVDKQPTVTHAQAGTAHTEAEPATTIDGTLADKPAEETVKPDEDKKEEKKTTAKEKVEKTKAEGKGFFAKFFGSKDKSPKKEKKKTPKVEKSDPIAETAPATEPIAPDAGTAGAAAAPEIVAAITEPVPEVSATAPEPAVKAPVIAEAPKEVAPTTTAAESPAENATAAEPAKGTKDEPSKPNLKANRRLSARIGDIFKIKKTHGPASPKEESAKETIEAPVAEETPAIASEAPKLEEPVATEPLKLEEEPKSSASAPAAPVISATA
ncbi:hypothetical protein IAR55_004507 [Kwoniella newhampshirensis]|uniref:Uncharacterized protein n=1 Tax=Kwoniella newhampshirensis TaxID=1651941 RepID=A0AAW0YNM4_9TREE